MKTIIVWGCLLLLVPVCRGVAQVTDAQRSEYAKGNQDPVFLKGYVDALKGGGADVEELGEAVERYLLVLPQEKRYVAENWGYFMEGVNDLNSNVLLDVLTNWEKLELSPMQKQEVVAKVERVCKETFFRSLLSEENDDKCPQIDCSRVLATLKASQVPVSVMRLNLMEMWEAWRMENLDGMIVRLETLFIEQERGENTVYDFLQDGVVLGRMLNYMLEECDFEQCLKLFDLTDKAVKKHGRDGFWSTIGKMRDNFEGKKMMMELGEE